MHELPPFVATLLAEGRIRASQLSGRANRLLRPLLEGGVLSTRVVGRGEIVIVAKPDHLLTWIKATYPGFDQRWWAAASNPRARSIALRRSSKAGGARIGATVLHVRAMPERGATMRVNSAPFPVTGLTAAYGVTACLIDQTTVLEISARTALVENLECFLAAEVVIPDLAMALNSAGRISGLLLDCLAQSSVAPQLLHFPDYDPVGLSDYLRLRSALGDKVTLFVPSDIETRFANLADRNLIAQKRRNRRLLETLTSVSWPCAESERIFRLIKDTGTGLEQESLLLSRSANAAKAPGPHGL